MVDVLRETCLNDGEILSVYCSEKCHFAINKYNKVNIHNMMYVNFDEKISQNRFKVSFFIQITVNGKGESEGMISCLFLEFFIEELSKFIQQRRTVLMISQISQA